MSDLYQQSEVVTNLHVIPRFGHTSSLAYLASTERSKRSEYVDGIVAFAIFLAFLSVLWAVILLVLKLYYGPSVVGCAAGGEGPVYVSQMRQDKIPRSERKRRIVRAWRTQIVFLLCSLSLTTATFLLLNHGWNPFLESLRQMNEVTYDFETKAQDGMEITSSLIALQGQMKQLVATDFHISSICPNYVSTSGDVREILIAINETIDKSVEEMNGFMDKHAPNVLIGLSQVTETARFVEEQIEDSTVNKYDRIIKGFIIGLNIVNFFLFVGALLARNSINYPCYQTLLSHFLVPVFLLMVLAVATAACVCSSLAILNADFCAGGVYPGSPKGTVEDILIEKGYGQGDLPWKALHYYSATECNGTSPLSFVNDFTVKVHDKKKLLSSVASFSNMRLISDECRGDVGLLNTTVHHLGQKLDAFERNLYAASNLTDCSSISPLLGRLLNGVPCSESVEGTAWLFGTTLGITILGWIMLSTRAALYTPVITPRRVKRREREFKEYKTYMGQFYDTSSWQLDPPPNDDVMKKDDPAADDGELNQVETFDTEETASPSSSSPASHSEQSIVFSTLWEENTRAEHSLFPAMDTSTVATSVASVAAAAATAVAMAGHHLTSRFQDDGIEIEYYSSDSEDEPDDASDEGGSKSTISGLVGRFFVVNRDNNNNNRQEEQQQATASESDSAAQQSSVESGSLDKNWKIPSAPTFLTPRRRRRRAALNGNHYITSAAAVERHNGKQRSVASPPETKKRLTPPRSSTQCPKTPRKKLKSIGRTVGASMIQRDANLEDNKE